MDDVPPSSATPARPAADSKPRRVITRPDRAKAARLPGTYAANFSDDPNWRRGVTVLWLLFGLAAVAELFHALFIVLSGTLDWPGPGDVARLCVEGVVFLLLWVGWSWPRWVLVAVDFAFGAWFIIRVIAPLPSDVMAAHPEVQVVQSITTIPQLALGIVYLVSAGYLAFSADVIGFTRHRREEGRGWVVAPIALIVAAWVALVCSLAPLTGWWFEQWRPDAGRFAAESLRAMSGHWDPASYVQRADADYLKTWPKDYRDPTFGTLSGLGPVQTMPEIQTSEGHPTSSPNGGSFVVRYHCEFGRVRFAHGTVHYGCMVSRHVLGAWRLENIEVEQPVFDPAP